MSNFVEVPIQKLSHGALIGLIEEYCNREGTDYGAAEYSLEQKTMNVLNAIEDGRAKIFFNKDDETVNILAVEEL